MVTCKVFTSTMAMLVLCGLGVGPAAWPAASGQAAPLSGAVETVRPSLKVAAIQARLRFFPTEAEFASYVMARMEEAMRYRPDLVVFPEDVGLPLVSLGECRVLCAESRTVQEAISKLLAVHAEELLAKMQGVKGRLVRGLWLLKAGRIRRAYQMAFQTAARKYRAYIVAGSVPMTFPEAPGEVFNTCCLFSPDGRMHVMGKKAHPIDLEGPEGLDFSAGAVESYRTFDLPWARIGCIVCADAWDPLVARRLVENGAQVLVQVSANPSVWTVAEQERWAEGLFARVQELGVYGVTCMAVGKLLDVPFEGRTQVVCPKAWTKDATGVLADVPVLRSEAIVVARLDLRRVVSGR